MQYSIRMRLIQSNGRKIFWTKKQTIDSLMEDINNTRKIHNVCQPLRYATVNEMQFQMFQIQWMHILT